MDEGSMAPSAHTIGIPEPGDWSNGGGYRDGAAGEAQFKNPICVAPEASGSMLVADFCNHCVRRVSADGAHVTTVAGVPGKAGHRDGAVGEAQFKNPTCVVPEASGSMLVVDSDNHCVRRVSADGAHVTTVAGVPGKAGHRDGAAGEAQFRYPRGVALEASGSMLVVERDNHCVRRVSADGAHVTTVAGVPGHRDGAAGEAQFRDPYCVALGASGSILVADTCNHCVRVFTGLRTFPASMADTAEAVARIQQLDEERQEELSQLKAEPAAQKNKLKEFETELEATKKKSAELEQELKAKSVTEGIPPSIQVGAVSASTLGCTMTWASAKAHCESLGRRLCRASEILDASGKFIFGPMAGDHWTPVLDAENEWVQIGEWEKSGHGRHGMAHNSLTNGTKGACGYAAPPWGLSDDPAQEFAHVKHTVYHVP